jgi:tetratricopeptide (TPR) repeat protein
MANAGDKDERIARLKAALEQKGGARPVAHPAQVPAPVTPLPQDDVPAPTRLPRLLEALARLLQPKPATPAQPAATVAAPEPPGFTVVVAALGGDADGSAHAHLMAALGRRAEFKLKALPKVFQLNTLEDPALVAGAMLNTRHAVAGEDADLLVWGDVAADQAKGGYRLRLTGAAAADDERAGSFGITTRIELPLAFDDTPAAMLQAAVLAAADAVNDAQKAAVKRLLPQLAAQVEPLAQRPPVALSMPQQRSAQLVYGHLAAATAQAVPAPQAGPWLTKAVESYRAALRRLGRTDPTWESGLIHKHVAAVMMLQADREKEPAPLLEEAVKEWREAAETLTRATMPLEWASTQVRLGLALYRLDLITGQTELLREAIQVLQGALQVYSRTETPQRWADVMNAIAQVLEVYGDQLRSPEVLQRAVDACHAVLDIRSRERTPLTWAATQNTLGGALFLLDRHTEGTSHLAEADQALSAALAVFQAHGAKGPAKVAAKNLGHVRKLAEASKGRQIIDPHWADD